MLETEFADFQDKIINYIYTGKLASGLTIDKMTQTIDGLELSQKGMLKRRLDAERRGLSVIEPYSIPPYLVTILTHGPEALKRACVVFCLTVAASAYCAPVFSFGSALIRGVGFGCTMFGASIAYDNSQCTLVKKYERVMQIQNMLDKFQLELQKDIGDSRILFKLSKIS